MIKSLILILTVIGVEIHLYSQNIPHTIDIAIFSDKTISRFSLTPTMGSYRLTDSQNRVLINLEYHNTLEFQKHDNGINVLRNDSIILHSDRIIVQGVLQANSILVRPANNNSDYRVYDGDILISMLPNGLRIINRSPLESYVAGTVQAEAGGNRHNVFYQVQAIIIRTYALKNLDRHRADGFNLCDRVHCQAFYGKTFYPDIIAAVQSTRGEVVVDSNYQLLNTVYHANCGGETVNSEDLWVQAKPYLRSKTDTFCINMPGARWTTTIPTAKFRDFWYSATGRRPTRKFLETIIQQQQNSRQRYFDENQQVQLRHIREHFRLRSTFFNISHRGELLHLSGRGFGHGVGLCQEGAMERARHGHTREEILNFYYKDARIINLERVMTDNPLFLPLLPVLPANLPSGNPL